MPVLKISLLVMVWASSYVAYTSPNPTPPKSSYRSMGPSLWASLFLQNRYSGARAIMQKIFLSGVILLEIAFASGIPSIRESLPSVTASTPPSFISPLFIFGVAFALCGALVRLWSYRALGVQFTFQLSLLKEHKLVITGPYAYVRHPSYTALVTTLLGILVCELSPGSWYVETRAFNSPLGKGMALTAICCFAIVLSVASRAPKEDQLLSERFGREWKEWEKRVPYRYIPGIL
ncbi:unnamed protein product [Peniophora sp. CBMAI 1063]|nr:unnamed protein product [Peniophora sp. CBMAI 1063]